jgi:hypothetical protein
VHDAGVVGAPLKVGPGCSGDMTWWLPSLRLCSKVFVGRLLERASLRPCMRMRGAVMDVEESLLCELKISRSWIAKHRKKMVVICDQSLINSPF